MHRLLGEYAKRVWQIGQARLQPDLLLVATVLTKRALSSAASLALSLRRRLESLGVPPSGTAQSRLPFGPLDPLNMDEDDADAGDVSASSAFDEPENERQMLQQILDSAERAAHNDRKISVLLRILRRIHEPVIVFTEYRDTLMVLEAAAATLRRTVVLHGGLSRHERRAAVESFTTGAADLLLATDAGAEGLNLQSRCRVVINLELPWNPVRLEQRIGRVDRLGQTRTVHAIHLFASETAESRVLARLVRRVERIHSEADIALQVIHDHQSRSTS
jgi:superfamily II DNA/RNA helicase